MVKFLVWGSEDLNYVLVLGFLQTISLCDFNQITESLGASVPFSKDHVADFVSLDNECFHFTIYNISTREALTSKH